MRSGFHPKASFFSDAYDNVMRDARRGSIVAPCKLFKRAHAHTWHNIISTFDSGQQSTITH
jgi:hypothetical protein